MDFPLGLLFLAHDAEAATSAAISLLPVTISIGLARSSAGEGGRAGGRERRRHHHWQRRNNFHGR